MYQSKEKIMELYKEILINVLERQKAEVIFSELDINVKEIVELKCYKALREIKAVLEDNTLQDDECFERIERIVCIFEQNFDGVNYRHDL